MRAFRWVVVILALGVAARDAGSEEGEDEAAPAEAQTGVPAGPPRGASDEERLRWLQKTIDQALASRPALAKARVGISVRETTTGRELVALHAGDAFNIASNVKLVTVAAALALLGPEYRYRTTLYIDEDAWDGGEAVKGNLYVHATGDPSLVGVHLAEMAEELARLGVRRIVGALVIDDTFFDGDETPPAFAQKKEDSAFRAPVSAASLNYNALALLVQPGAASGAPARATLVPDSAYLQLAASVTTVEDGRTQLQVKLAPRAGRPPRLAVEVSGTIRRDAGPTWLRRRVEDPTEFFGEAFRAALADRGIRVKRKGLERRALPQTAKPLVVHTSEPLAVLARDLNKYSNNFMAETVLKTIGAERGGRPGTWKAGAEAVRTWLAQSGLEGGAYRYDNGSGLYDSNRFTASQLTTLLRAVYQDFRISSDFVASLAIAGVDGTLRNRLIDTPAARWIRAKTGTLRNVTTLSGYAGAGGRAPLAFSVLVNDLPDKISGAAEAARSLEDEIAQALTLYLTAE